MRESIKKYSREIREASEHVEQSRLQVEAARADARSTRQTLKDWLSTLSTTENVEQDSKVVYLTEKLEKLQSIAREVEEKLEKANRQELDAKHIHAKALRELGDMEAVARKSFDKAQRKQELRVFGYRLLFTLPLLVVAAWLFRCQRNSRWWPFVWGFVIFSGFTFFVELVPYLPSYGGYVRYTVGIIITVIVGRWGIVGLQHYLERQKAAEGRPESQRRKELFYDVAHAFLSKGLCPGCERPVDLKTTLMDFCPHCGIGLFNSCRVCNTRKSCFARFCQNCGSSVQVQSPQTLPQVEDVDFVWSESDSPK